MHPKDGCFVQVAHKPKSATATKASCVGMNLHERLASDSGFLFVGPLALVLVVAEASWCRAPAEVDREPLRT